MICTEMLQQILAPETQQNRTGCPGKGVAQTRHRTTRKAAEESLAGKVTAKGAKARQGCPSGTYPEVSGLDLPCRPYCPLYLGILQACAHFDRKAGIRGGIEAIVWTGQGCLPAGMCA